MTTARRTALGIVLRSTATLAAVALGASLLESTIVFPPGDFQELYRALLKQFLAAIFLGCMLIQCASMAGVSFDQFSNRREQYDKEVAPLLYRIWRITGGVMALASVTLAAATCFWSIPAEYAGIPAVTWMLILAVNVPVDAGANFAERSAAKQHAVFATWFFVLAWPAYAARRGRRCCIEAIVLIAAILLCVIVVLLQAAK